MASFMLSMFDVASGVKAKYVDSSDMKFFCDGIGDTEAIDSLFQNVEENGVGEYDDIEIRFDKDQQSTSNETIEVRRGSFTSPFQAFLEGESNKKGLVEMILPRDRENMKGVVLLLPMTGDMGFSYRRNNLAKPLAEAGYGSVSLMIAYYGARKPHNQTKHYVRTVAGYTTSCFTSFCEGGKLLKWMSKQFEGIPLGASGLSFGGIAACAASVLYEGDVVLVPCVGGSNASRGFQKGVLAAQVSKQNLSSEEDKKALFEALGRLNLSRLLRAREDRMSSQRRLEGVLITARLDKYIPRDDSDALSDALNAICSDASRKFVDGGHISTIMKSKKILVPEIIEAFEHFSKNSKVGA